MEEFYRVDPVISCSNNDDVGVEFENITTTATTSCAIFHHHHHHRDHLLPFDQYEAMGREISDLIKAQIANHPRYPYLVAAYIECQKVKSLF